jgi:hypothetical protein
MPQVPDIDALEDLWTLKLLEVEGVRSAISIGQLEELESERIFKMPGAIVMNTGMSAEQPQTLGHPVFQEGSMGWSIFIVCAGMRGQKRARSGEDGSNRVSKRVIENCNGWEIVPGWIVYFVDLRPYNVGEASKSIMEIRFSHQIDIEGL